MFNFNLPPVVLPSTVPSPKNTGILPPVLLPGTGNRVEDILKVKIPDFGIPDEPVTLPDGNFSLGAKTKSILKNWALPLILIGSILVGVLVSRWVK